MPNKLITPEEMAKRCLDSWNCHIQPHLDEMKADGASEEEIAEVTNAALAHAFGGLWTSPQ